MRMSSRKRTHSDVQAAEQCLRKYSDVFRCELLAQVPSDDKPPCFYAIAKNSSGVESRVFVKGPLSTSDSSAMQMMAACLLSDKLKPMFQLRAIGTSVAVVESYDESTKAFIIMVDVCNGDSVPVDSALHCWHNDVAQVDVFTKSSSSVQPLRATSMNVYSRDVRINIFMHLALRFVLGVQTAELDDILVDTDNQLVYSVDETILFVYESLTDNLIGQATCCQETAITFIQLIISPNKLELLSRLGDWRNLLNNDTAIPYYINEYAIHIGVDTRLVFGKCKERLDYLIDYIHNNELLCHPLYGGRAGVHAT